MRGRPGGLIAYAAAWLAGGALVATLLVVALGPRGDDVSLPPLGESRLEDAARHARCELRTADGPRSRLDPPVAGARRAVALRPGVYDEPPDRRAVVAAIRRGTVVLHYRPGVSQDEIDGLEEVQRSVPNGTIVVPDSTGMRYAMAATAWRRLLGCPRVSRQAIDAVRIFQGRFLGTGPDRP